MGALKLIEDLKDKAKDIENALADVELAWEHNEVSDHAYEDLKQAQESGWQDVQDLLKTINELEELF